MKTIILSCYPACGKTWAFLNQKLLGYKILDSDSSDFSWVDKEDHELGRNPNFPDNYIEHIKENINKYDIIFISSHLEVRKALRENKIKYYTVYPKIDCKEDWLDRMRNRGNSEEFIRKQDEMWEKNIKNIHNEPHGSNIFWLGKGEKVSGIVCELHGYNI